MKIVTFWQFCVQLLQVCFFSKSFPVFVGVAACSLRHIKRLAKFLFSPAQKAPVPHADPFLAHLTHEGQTLFLVFLSLCIVNQLVPVSAPFTALGTQAVWQSSTQSSVSSGWGCFALQIISPGMTQPQGRHVLKWRGTTMKFPSFPGWKLQAARADVRGSKTGEMPSVQAV